MNCIACDKPSGKFVLCDTCGLESSERIIARLREENSMLIRKLDEACGTAAVSQINHNQIFEKYKDLRAALKLTRLAFNQVTLYSSEECPLTAQGIIDAAIKAIDEALGKEGGG